MALKAGRVGVHPDDVDLNGHIKNSGGGGDLSAYVKKTDAPGYNDILTQTSASSTYLTQSSATSTYQEKLVSGTNIKTINNESLLGSGNIVIQGGGEPIDLSGYVQKIEAPGYSDILTQTSASSIYQTQADMSDYQTVGGMSSYVAKSEATGYNDILTRTSASSTYQTQSGMSSYQTVSGMSSYVAKSEATGYNDILTTTNAATVYQTKLSSGVNIKTINNSSILTSGNLSLQETLVSGTNIKTINGSSLLGSGNLAVSSIYGLYATNIIASGNNYNSSGTITAVLNSQPLATNCILVLSYNQASQMALNIDGVSVAENYMSAYFVIPLAQGQVITHAKTNNHAYWKLYSAVSAS